MSTKNLISLLITTFAIILTTCESTYLKYNILEFCNSGVAHEIKIETNSNGTATPALLVLSHNKTKISNQTCIIRFSLPASKWYEQNGLILGIDEISIKSNTNKSCDDYIQISGSDFKSRFKWCENKTNEIGQSFNGSGYLDIVFHAGEDSKSEFKLVITPFEGPLGNWCFKSSDLKCSDNGNYECISKQYEWDGHNNCPNGDDEAGRSTPTPTVSTTLTTPTTTSSTTITTTSPPHPPSPLSPGSIGLIVIGTIVGIFYITGLVYICWKNRRQNTIGYTSLKRT